LLPFTSCLSFVVRVAAVYFLSFVCGACCCRLLLVFRLWCLLLPFSSSSSSSAGARKWPPHSPRRRTSRGAGYRKIKTPRGVPAASIGSGRHGLVRRPWLLAFSSWEPGGERWESKNTTATLRGCWSFPPCAPARCLRAPWSSKWGDLTGPASPCQASRWPPSRGPHCARGTR